MKRVVRRTVRIPRGVSSRWGWHYRFLRALRERLIESEGERRRAIVEPPGTGVGDTADIASEESEHEFSAALWSAEQNALTEVDDALERLRLGRYGICEVTGRPIPAGRLRAIPWTRYLARVEDDLERYSALNPGLGTALRTR